MMITHQSRKLNGSKHAYPPRESHAISFRAAPHSIEAEQALLGAILVENAAYLRVADLLRPEHFFDPLHARIYETLGKLIVAGKRATPITVKTFFEHVEPINTEMTVPQYLGRLVANATTTINAVSYAETIRFDAKRREIIVLCEATRDHAYDCGPDETAASLISLATTHIRKMEADEQALQPKSLLTYADQLRLSQSSRYLVKQLLSAGSVAALYGPSCAGKTFYALNLVFHIALGIPFNGRRVAQAPVLYVVLEGAADFPKRLVAAKTALGDPGNMFAILNEGISLGTGSAGDAGVATLVSASKEMERDTGQMPGIIVIDTTARAMAGDNENEAQAFSALFAKVGRIQAATGATILFIHHPGKNETLGMRGSSSFFAGLDTVIRIEREKDQADRSVFLEKSKDGMDGPLQTFTLKTVPLGVDDEGDEITSCVIDSGDGASGRSRRMRPASASQAGKALSELEHLIIGGRFETISVHDRIPYGAKVVNKDEWRQACLAKRLSDTGTASAEEKAFNRAVRTLESASWISSRADKVWIITDIARGQ